MRALREVGLTAAALGLAALAAAQSSPATPSPTPTPAPSPAAKPRPRASPTPTPGPPDVYVLRNGDRITGRTVSRTPKAFGVQTPFGRVTIPRTRVAKLVRADGGEEVFNPPDEAAAGATPASS